MAPEGWVSLDEYFKNEVRVLAPDLSKPWSSLGELLPLMFSGETLGTRETFGEHALTSLAQDLEIYKMASISLSDQLDASELDGFLERIIQRAHVAGELARRFREATERATIGGGGK